MLQALFAFYWETQKKKKRRNLQSTFFTMAPVRPRENPHEESILCLYEQNDSHCGRRQRPFGSLQTRFTFLLTICDVVPTEVEQLYQKDLFIKYTNE